MEDATRPVISIKSRHFMIFQLAIPVVLIGLSTFHYILHDFYNPGRWADLTLVFDVGRENSLPTAVSALNLFLSAILLYFAFVVDRGKKTARGWLALSLIFILLSMDEIASFHERLAWLNPVTGLEFGILGTNKWVVYGAIISVIAFLIFIPFLMNLPRKIMMGLIIAGGFFVGGAVGLEFVGAVMLEKEIVSSRDDTLYWFRRLFEEGFEMLGVSILNIVLFGFLSPRGFLIKLNSGTTA